MSADDLPAGRPATPYHTMLPDMDIRGRTCALVVRGGMVDVISFSTDVLSLLALAVRLNPSVGRSELEIKLENAGVQLRDLACQAGVDAMNLPPDRVANGIHLHKAYSAFLVSPRTIHARHPGLSRGIMEAATKKLPARTYGDMFKIGGLHLRREYARRLSRCTKFAHLVRCQNGMRRLADAAYASAYMMDFDNAYAQMLENGCPVNG